MESTNKPNFGRFEMKVSELADLVSIPDFQRIKDDDHCLEIVEYNKKCHEMCGQFNIFGSISLGTLKHNDIFHILDGQHRLEAYKLLVQEYGDFIVYVDIYERDSMDELIDIYDRINRNKPVPMLTDNHRETAILNEFLRLFEEKYKDNVKKSNNPQAPNLNLDKLQKAIISSDIIKKCSFSSGSEMMKSVSKLNVYFSSLPLKVLNQKTVKWGITTKNTSTRFFLGYFKDFEWLGFIIKYVSSKSTSYDTLSDDFRSIKGIESIPKSTRVKLWSSCYDKKQVGKCYICDYEVTAENFEAGHIVSRIFGGSNELSNFKVLCKTCNRDMGNMDMEKYKKKFS